MVLKGRHLSASVVNVSCRILLLSRGDWTRIFLNRSKSPMVCTQQYICSKCSIANRSNVKASRALQVSLTGIRASLLTKLVTRATSSGDRFRSLEESSVDSAVALEIASMILASMVFGCFVEDVRISMNKGTEKESVMLYKTALRWNPFTTNAAAVASRDGIISCRDNHAIIVQKISKDHKTLLHDAL